MSTVRPRDAHAVKVAVNGRYTFCTRRRDYDLVEGLEERNIGTVTKKPGRTYKDVHGMQKIMKFQKSKRRLWNLVRPACKPATTCASIASSFKAA